MLALSPLRLATYLQYPCKQCFAKRTPGKMVRGKSDLLYQDEVKVT